MKLKQGQIWKTETAFVRIVTLERLSVDYKSMKDLETMEGTHEKVTKKAFCRLLKDATLPLSCGARLTPPAGD